MKPVRIETKVVRPVGPAAAPGPARREPDPWQISAEEFPTDGAPEEQIWFLLNYAILAPSPLNTQPWRFHIQKNQVDVHADWHRALRVLDPAGRELTMSAGAVLFLLRVAMEYFGRASRVQLLPEEGHPSLLARVWLGMHCETPAEVLTLFNAIQQRRTNRRPFRPDPVPEVLLADLRAEAEAEGAWLQFIATEEARNAVADLVAQADRAQWANKEFRSELALWLHPNRSASRDGLPGYAEGFGDLMSRVGPLVVRTFDLGKGHAAKDRDIALGSPVLAVLGTEEDGPLPWLAAGQAMARVLLRAQAEGVSASSLNQPVEVVELRPQLAQWVGREDFPQALLRLGYGQAVAPNPRRPLKEFLM
jgi:hypothetical protein